MCLIINFSRENKTELNENRKIGDLVLKHMNQGTMEHYYRYIDTHVLILENLEQALHRNNKFEQVYRDFEMQKVMETVMSNYSISYPPPSPYLAMRMRNV